MSDHVLAATNITRTFSTPAGEVTALREASLTLGAGELVVVQGRSGSGKTTLLNILGGLDRPSSGTVVLADGRELGGLAEAELFAVRREVVGFIFQSFGLIPVLSAAENVEVPLRLRHTPAAERESRVADALAMVGLTDHALQRPDELSGGQQQRVGIARALVAQPQVLLADEPTAQLDSRTAETVMDLLVTLAHTRGVGMVVATHDPAMVARADRVLQLTDGVLA